MSKIQQFIESVFDEDYNRVASAKHFRELDDWDSLKYLTLIVAMQSAFGVELSPEEIGQVTSIAAIEEVLNSKGVKV